MKSLYKRQLLMIIGIMVLSFTLLSAAFMLLSYRYIITEKREAMERNANYVANFTATYYQQYLGLNEFYSSYMASIALISDSHIIVADSDGDILYATDGRQFFKYGDTSLPPALVQQVATTGSYTGMTIIARTDMGFINSGRCTAWSACTAKAAGNSGNLCLNSRIAA